MENFGVVYLAFGGPYLAMAMLSRKTLRQSNPNWPACIITNVSPTAPSGFEDWGGDDIWTYIEADTADNRLFKVGLYDHSPFDKTLFLDCDTLVTEDLSDALIYLNYFDAALKLKGGGVTSSVANGVMLDGQLDVGQSPHWNSGFIAFRKGAATEKLFRDWAAIYSVNAGQTGDQTSLAEAIFLGDCRVLSLDGRWNFTKHRIPAFKAPPGVKVVHYMSWVSKPVRRLLEAYAAMLERPAAELSDFLKKRLAQRRSRGRFRSLLFSLRF